MEGKKCSPPPNKVSIGLFILEQDYKKSAKGGIIRGRECLAIATILNINKEALTVALEYFHDLDIFLYYPSVLPKVVLSSLNIQSSKSVVLGLAPGNEARRQVAAVSKQGMVTVEDERFLAHYIPDLFTPADLSKQFEHLLMVTLPSTE